MVNLIVGTQVDDNSIRNASNEIQRRFDKIGQQTGDSFMSKFSASVTTESAKVVKAMDKAADATGRLRSEQAKLDDLAGSSASHSQLVRQSEAVARARRAEASAVRNVTDAMRDAASSGSGLSNFLGGISQGASGTRLGELAGQAEMLSTRLSGISAGGMAAAGGITAIVAASAAAGKAMYDMGAQWDDITDSIAARTGMMGDDLDAITGSVRRVGRDVAAPLDQIGDVAGRVSQSLRLTGQPLDDMVKAVSQLNELTGERTDVRGLGKAFRMFDISDAGEERRALDGLMQASQSTGASVNDLIGVMNSTGKTAKEFGLTFGETAGLVATLDEAGLDFTKAAPALSIALKNFAADGREPQQALRDTIAEIKNLSDAQRDVEAADLAAKTFGKGYIDFLSAIKSGKLDVEALTGSLKNNGTTIDGLYKSTEDWHEEWKKLTNTMSSAFAPAAETVFGSINQWLHYTTAPMQHLLDMLDEAGNSDALGRSYGGGNFGPSNGQPGIPSAPPRDGWWPDLHAAGINWGSPDDARRRRDDAAREAERQRKESMKLPEAPVLPYDTSVPAWAVGLPSSAQNSYMSAHNNLLEKQARADQLQQSAAASQADRQKAENDVITAGQQLVAAQESLAKARESAYDKETKQLKDHTAAMQDIGVALDNDFGLSNGLPGLAENLVKFLGSLAAAPLLGPLAAIKDAAPDQGGSGLIGILAAQMPQYQTNPEDRVHGGGRGGAAADNYSSLTAATGGSPVPVAVISLPGGIGSSALGSSGLSSSALSALSPSAPAGLPKPGESARDFAHRVMMPFFQNQGLTVGDHAADKYGEHQNGALDIMVKDLAQGQQVLKEVLSDPNVYGAIFNNQTYGYGHGLTPQDYSAGHTGDPTQDHQDHVHAWYKPGGGNNIVPSGGGGSWDLPIPSSMPSSIATTPAPSYTLDSLNPAAPGGWFGTPTAASGVGPGPLPGPGGGAPGGAGLFGPFPQAAPFDQQTLMPVGGQAGTPGAFASSMIPGQVSQGAPGGVGSGSMISGLPLAALQGAASALDVFPGAGAAANLAIQLTNRAIGYGAGMAGNAVSGLLETFSLSGSGGMTDPMKSLPGRLLGALAQARPAIPNTAAQKQQGQQDQQQQQSPQGAQGPNTGPLVNIEQVHQAPGQSPDSVANSVANQFRSYEYSGGFHGR